MLGFQVSSESNVFLQGEINVTYWWPLKDQTTLQISFKLVRKHPKVKLVQMMGMVYLFLRDDNESLVVLLKKKIVSESKYWYDDSLCSGNFLLTTAVGARGATA